MMLPALHCPPHLRAEAMHHASTARGSTGTRPDRSRPAPPGRTVDRDESGPTDKMAEVRLRVAIPTVRSESEVESAIGRAEYRAARNAGPTPHSHAAQLAIRHLPAIGVFDDDIAGSRDGPTEGDPARSNGSNGTRSTGLKVNTPAPSAISTRRRTERVNDGAGHRRLPTGNRRRDGSETEGEY